MSRDYEYTNNASGSAGGSTGLKSAFRRTFILALLAFLGGALVMGWLAVRYDLLGSGPQPSTKPALASAAKTGNSPQAVAALPTAGTNGLAPVMVEPDLATKVAMLEDRISRITTQAEAASGNASRAEGMLIAFAARRALDTGSTLGYIEGQLQLRFGAAQPNAVATIINASRRPVTVDQLRAELDLIAPSLTGRAADEGIWRGFRREMGALFVLRTADTPSTAPEQRLERARRYLESNRVDAALAEVKLLPARKKAATWIASATNYITARQALDLIETAAILEPKDAGNPVTSVQQPVPLGTKPAG